MRDIEDIAVWDYEGPQGSKELDDVVDSNVTRRKSRTRVKTMNRRRRVLGMQSGTPEISISFNVKKNKGASMTVDWKRAWERDEVFNLTQEKGLDGLRERYIDCMVADCNDTHNENGEAMLSLTIEACASKDG
jgi:hypothetical protein